MGSEFHVTFRKVGKDPYTDKYLTAMGLSQRQIQAVSHVQQKGTISNEEYRTQLTVSARTATSDLKGLVDKGGFAPSDGRGPAARYQIKK